MVIIKRHKAIDDYIQSFPTETQMLLSNFRELIFSEIPDCEELISYGIPSYKYKSKYLVHFAGYNKHIGFYPTPVGIKEFEADFTLYKTGKGSVQFPLEKEMPWELISRIIQFRKLHIENNE